MTSDISKPLTGISVEKTAGKQYRISWDEKGKEAVVQVFAGDSPATIDLKKPIAETRGGSDIVVTLPEKLAYPYFSIALKGHSGVVWAER